MTWICRSRKWSEEGDSVRGQQWALGAFSLKKMGLEEEEGAAFDPLPGAHVGKESL